MSFGIQHEGAFPTYIVDNETGTRHVALGLTKREYFAGLILQGLAVPAIAGGHNLNDDQESSHKAFMAVKLADKLIEELNKGNP